MTKQLFNYTFETDLLDLKTKVYNHISENVGTTSRNGNASSIKDITAAIFPSFPLYNLVIK